ncbi:MAG: amidase family protein [Acidobacteriota bacterium]
MTKSICLAAAGSVALVVAFPAAPIRAQRNEPATEWCCFGGAASPPAPALRAGDLTTAVDRAEQPRTFDLLTASVAGIQAAVDAGRLTYEQLVQMYLRRIEAYDKQGPRLNAVIEIHPRAVEIARELDAERRAKGRRSPLHGIPIAVKDTVDVKDIASAGGNIGLKGTFPTYDATVVARLRAAGALIFFKANLDEFNLGSEGISSLAGQTLNPYDVTRNPGGSSSGPAVAVNVGFATLGIATETGASIRSPASNNSLVGIAPTQGLTSRAGVIAISYTQDRVGVHAKSVEDAALMLTYMRGLDPEDLFTWESLGRLTPAPYTAHLDVKALVGARLGVFRDLFRKEPEFQAVNAIIDKEIDLIRQQRAVVIDGLTTGMDLVKFFPQARASTDEFRFAFDAYLKRRGSDTPFASLEELVASGRYLKQFEGTFKRALSIEAPDFDGDYLARLKNRLTVRKLIVDLMDRYQVDALVHPFKSLGAPPLGTGDRGPRDNPISAITGLPAIVVPAGVDAQGLPIAIEFLGRPFSEPALLALAHAYEQVSRRRVAPKTTPHLAGDVFTY